MTDPASPARPAPPFAGRARELQAVAAGLARLQAGQGGAILLSGEPGIGKTSLAGQVAVRAADLGVPVTRGSCAEYEGAPRCGHGGRSWLAARPGQDPATACGSRPTRYFRAWRT